MADCARTCAGAPRTASSIACCGNISRPSSRRRGHAAARACPPSPSGSFASFSHAASWRAASPGSVATAAGTRSWSRSRPRGGVLSIMLREAHGRPGSSPRRRRFRWSARPAVGSHVAPPAPLRPRLGRGASVVGRVATGPRAGQPVMRIGRASDATLITSGGERHAHAGGFDLHANVAVFRATATGSSTCVATCFGRRWLRMLCRRPAKAPGIADPLMRPGSMVRVFPARRQRPPSDIVALRQPGRLSWLSPRSKAPSLTRRRCRAASGRPAPDRRSGCR